MPKKLLNKLTTRASFVFFTFIVFLATFALVYRARRFDSIYPYPLGDVEIVDSTFMCTLRPTTNLCNEFVKKYYFDKDTKTCKQFIWGGCDKNVPFDAFEVCNQTCVVDTSKNPITNSIYLVYTKYILPLLPSK